MNKENEEEKSVVKSRSKESCRSRKLRLPTPPPDPTTSIESNNEQHDENQKTHQLNDEIQQQQQQRYSESDSFNKETEILEYILSLASAQKAAENDSGDKQQLARTNPLFAQAIVADDAFDHLEKLYKLMEQLLNLREQNSRLQRRVRDLEQLKAMQDMHLKLNYNPNDKIIFQDLEADPEYAEIILDNILAAGRNASFKRNSKYKSSNQSRFRQSLLGKSSRDRSQSVAIDDYSPCHENTMTYSDGSIYIPSKSPYRLTSKPAKVSKWKKVKAAFKWEKASTGGMSGHTSSTSRDALPISKSQDSGLGMSNSNNEVVKYLRVPSSAAIHSSGGGVSPADSVLSGQSSPGIRTSGKDLSISVPETPASLSSASSVDDINQHEIDDNQKEVTSEKSRRQRLSGCSDEDIVEDRRRSKSIDENLILGNDDDNIYYTKQWNYNKSHKTPWGKVKGIIQTRKESLKKSRTQSNIKGAHDGSASDRGISPNQYDRQSGSNADICSFSSEEYPDVFESNINEPGTNINENINQSSHEENQNLDSLNAGTCKSDINRNNLKSTTKRPPPTLNIAIPPCTEKNKKVPDTPGKEDKNNLPPDIVKRYQELVLEDKIGQSHRHTSRWNRVKKAFLNKYGEDASKISQSQSASTPVSPTRYSVFFPDDSDEATYSSLDYSNKASHKELQDEIRKNYEELQNKLSLEFQEKLLEWDRLRSTSNYTSQNQISNLPPITHLHESDESENYKRAGDDFNKLKQVSSMSSRGKDGASKLTANSEHLSEDFKRKLQEWQRIKKEQTHQLPSTSQNNNSTKKKITDNWQLFKTSTLTTPKAEEHSNAFRYPDTKQLSDDFLKKLEEWKHMKATNTVPTYSGYKDDEDHSSKNSTGNKSPSPSFRQKDCTGGIKSPRNSGKKSKVQGNKELQMLEKEIQKIEREKLRLEREREKYLEREERLAKLRRSLSGNHQKKEVLVQTSTGFFRFQGISRKFTQRLYEWEKARGIGPEESTLTLLSPSYKPIPPNSITRKAEDLNQLQSQGGLKLVRSKSMDSVANLTVNQSNTAITHQPSSLSLNDVEELEAECLAAESEHTECESENMLDLDMFEEPEAVIVDIEAVEEETASPLDENVAIPICVTHTPVYKYEEQQEDMLCEGEECLAPKVQGGDSNKTQSSYHLIEENITLLNKLKDKEEICRQLETGIEDIEGEMNNLERTRNDEIEKLEQEILNEQNSQNNLRQHRIQELERKKRKLEYEGVNLQNSFAEHKAQQTKLAQHLVGSMRKLQEVNSSMTLSVSTPNVEESSSNQQLTEVAEMVQDLSSELLILAEKLESSLANHSKVLNQKESCNKSKHMKDKQWCSIDLGATYTYNRINSRENSTEAKELSSLLTNKILELKRGLSYICAASDLTAPRQNKKTTKVSEALVNESINNNKGCNSKENHRNIQKSDSVPNVTITPKFLRRQGLSKISSTEQHAECSVSTNKEGLSESFRRTSSEGRRKSRSKSKNDIEHVSDSDDDDDDSTNNLRKSKQYRSYKNRQILDQNENTEQYPNTSRANINKFRSDSPANNNVLVETNPQFVKYEISDRSSSPVEVFVKTIKTVFPPVDSSTDNTTKKSFIIENTNSVQNRYNSQDLDRNINYSPVLPRNRNSNDNENNFSSGNAFYKYDLPDKFNSTYRSPSQSPIFARRRLFERAQSISNDTSSEEMKQNNLISSKSTRTDSNTNNDCTTSSFVESPKNFLRKTLSSDAFASSLPPLPNSPTPNRRDRSALKETAPSIRLMIARYNQRLNEQEGGKSPGGSSGSASPVAWRSPVFERRVRAQTERYQEEVQRAFHPGNWPKNEITKSASVGFIRSNEVLKKSQTSMETFEKTSEIPQTPPSKRLLRGILKSSSAGSLKSDRSNKVDYKIEFSDHPNVDKSDCENKNISNENNLQCAPVNNSFSGSILKNFESELNSTTISALNMPPKITRKYDIPPFPKTIPQIPSSPESLHTSPQSKLRALKIQKAKESFLARQIPSPVYINTPQVSVQSNTNTDPTNSDQNDSISTHRLSQISCESESSYDEVKSATNDGLLIKSASAGMINIEANAYRHLASSEMHSQGYVSLPRSNRSYKDIIGAKFGISNITSKFRKVKMRKHKDKESNKMNTISMLCRQSLFVDISDNSGELSNQNNASTSRLTPTEPGCSKSSSNSPVLQRHQKPGPSSGWKSKILKPK